jgi:hypothetical protein
MNSEQIMATWNLELVNKELQKAFIDNSEEYLLSILKNNTFLFYELFSRKHGIQPIFHEISFGGDFRCDFAWLNDNSDGPEWVLVELEKPNLELFRKNGEPTQFLHHTFEQVKSWRRYFNENPADKRRIFGAVARFRYIIVAGDINSWTTESAAKWRIDNNRESEIELRSSDVFRRSLELIEEHPEEFWSFAENPSTLNPSQLQNYWEHYGYMDTWRKMIN